MVEYDLGISRKPCDFHCKRTGPINALFNSLVHLNCNLRQFIWGDRAIKTSCFRLAAESRVSDSVQLKSYLWNLTWKRCIK